MLVGVDSTGRGKARADAGYLVAIATNGGCQEPAIGVGGIGAIVTPLFHVAAPNIMVQSAVLAGATDFPKTPVGKGRKNPLCEPFWTDRGKRI